MASKRPDSHSESKPSPAGKRAEAVSTAQSGNDVLTAVRLGDRRRGLEALRDSLAAAMDESSVGVKAQIAAQLRATLKEIAELPDGKKVTVVDDLISRRTARRAAAQAAALAAGDSH